MSSPFVSRNETRKVMCPKCGRLEVTERKFASAYTGEERWDIDQHDAPCGLPCMEGGVHPKAFRERQVHGARAFPCPRCS